ncbi:MAG: AlpA family phage regulatory protein [Methylotenera sp.]|nr:AlpA family phage regulatory protein [Methylotenera sp.]
MTKTNDLKPREPRRPISLPVNSLPDDALVNIQVVSDVSGLKTTAIYGRIKKHSFPSPEKFGTRCTRWRLGKLRRWLADPWNYVETI